MATRRHFLLATSCAVWSACAPRARTAGTPGTPAPPGTPALQNPSDGPGAQRTPDVPAAIERRVGGRLGVYALDTGSGRALSHRPDERFAMCSTFKWLLAAAVLARVDDGRLSLDERVSYGPEDLIEHAPVTGAHVGEGGLTIGALTEAIVTVSDNTAANLLLEKTGGPAGLTQYARSLGDPVTRLDRRELELNTNHPGDPRDTTSPRAMVRLMQEVLVGDALSPASRERLLGWLRAAETGKRRLRAGLPRDWLVGDKTGSGGRGSVNDVAIAVPPGRAPILIAAYMSGSTSTFEALEAGHAEVGGWVAHESRVAMTPSR